MYSIRKDGNKMAADVYLVRVAWALVPPWGLIYDIK